MGAGVEGLTFGSVCSGIEAASVAWEPLGWRAAFLSEIAPFPRAVLAHHYPDVPLRGDFTEIQAGDHDPIDLLVGGTPCQSFSIAGLRGGLGDERGNLALQYLRLADRLRPRWLVWENVPGVLSSNGGRDFGSILGGMGELGYGVAYRVLDAQHFGLAQRRARVFVVGYLGDWRRAAAVLFEPASLRGHPAPRREAGEGVAAPIAAGSPGGSGYRNDADTADNLIARCLTAKKGCWSDGESETFIASREVSPTLRAQANASHRADSEDGTGRGTPLVPVPSDTTQITSAGNYSKPKAGDPYHPLAARAHPPAVAFDWYASKSQGMPVTLECPPLKTTMQPVVMGAAIRRLIPRECERLQGFRDDYTRIPVKTLASKPRSKHFAAYPDHYERNADGTWTRFAADGPRYQALGNSMAVPVMAWIGRRIATQEAA